MMSALRISAPHFTFHSPNHLSGFCPHPQPQAHNKHTHTGYKCLFENHHQHPLSEDEEPAVCERLVQSKVVFVFLLQRWIVLLLLLLLLCCVCSVVLDVCVFLFLLSLVFPPLEETFSTTCWTFSSWVRLSATQWSWCRIRSILSNFYFQIFSWQSFKWK